MKKILCYGDSNTWGYNPHTGERFDSSIRWPGVMASLLSEEYNVIEDGCNGRSALNLSETNAEVNGLQWISSKLKDYMPLHIVLISLGINDVFDDRSFSAEEITGGISRIIDTVKDRHFMENYSIPCVIIMSPPLINEKFEGAEFYSLQINKAKHLGELYNRLAVEKGCFFFNSAEFAEGSEIDSTHIDAGPQRNLGIAIAGYIKGNIK